MMQMVSRDVAGPTSYLDRVYFVPFWVFRAQIIHRFFTNKDPLLPSVNDARAQSSQDGTFFSMDYLLLLSLLLSDLALDGQLF